MDELVRSNGVSSRIYVAKRSRHRAAHIYCIQRVSTTVFNRWFYPAQQVCCPGHEFPLLMVERAVSRRVGGCNDGYTRLRHMPCSCTIFIGIISPERCSPSSEMTHHFVWNLSTSVNGELVVSFFYTIIWSDVAKSSRNLHCWALLDQWNRVRHFQTWFEQMKSSFLFSWLRKCSSVLKKTVNCLKPNRRFFSNWFLMSYRATALINQTPPCDWPNVEETGYDRYVESISSGYPTVITSPLEARRRERDRVVVLISFLALLWFTIKCVQIFAYLCGEARVTCNDAQFCAKGRSASVEGGTFGYDLDETWASGWPDFRTKKAGQMPFSVVAGAWGSIASLYKDCVTSRFVITVRHNERSQSKEKRC